MKIGSFKNKLIKGTLQKLKRGPSSSFRTKDEVRISEKKNSLSIIRPDRTLIIKEKKTQSGLDKMLQFARVTTGTALIVSLRAIHSLYYRTFESLKSQLSEKVDEVSGTETKRAKPIHRLADILRSGLSEHLGFLDQVGNAFMGTREDMLHPAPPLSKRLKSKATSSSALTLKGPKGLHRPVTDIDGAFMKSMQKSGYIGKTILAGGGDVEDQSILVWASESKGEKILNLRCRLTPEGHKNLMKKFTSKPDLKLIKDSYEYQTFKVKDGKLTDSPEMSEIPSGKSYNLRLNDKTFVNYSPYEENYTEDKDSGLTPYSHQGVLSVKLKNPDMSPGELQDLLKDLAGAGINTKPATPEDLELSYLKKMGKALSPKEAKKVESTLKNAKTSDQVRIYQKFLSGVVGVQDVTKLEGYNWKPQFGTYPGFSEKDAVGKPWWNRFDSKTYLKNELKSHRLTHNLHYNGDKIGEFITNVLGVTGGLSSGEERLSRLGINMVGISPLGDRRTGGASYVFNHLSKDLDRDTFVFSNELMGRLDAIANPMGVYGRVQGKSVKKQIPLDSMHRLPIYEVMIKDTIPLLTYLERVNVNNEKEKQAVIKAFNKAGVSQIRGNPLKDVVKIRR